MQNRERRCVLSHFSPLSAIFLSFFCIFAPVMKYGNCIFFLLLFLWCLPLCLAGQPVYDVLDLRDGLAESRVRSIAEMPDGKLAIATAGTISVYDGTCFHVCELPAERAYALPGYHGYRCLSCDDAGRVWLRNAGTLYVIHPSNFPSEDMEVLRVDSVLQTLGWKGGAVTAFFVDEGTSPQRYWVVDEVGVLFCLRDGQCRRVADLSSFGDETPEQIVTCGDDIYLCYHTGRVCRLRTTVESFSEERGAMLVYDGASIEEDEYDRMRHGISVLLYDGKLWLTLNHKSERHSYIVRFDTASNRWLPAVRLSMRNSSFAVAPDSTIHVVGNRGEYVLSFEGDVLHHQRLQPVVADGVERMVADDLSCILFDRYGGVWIGSTESGLLYRHPSRRGLICVMDTPYPHKTNSTYCSERARLLAESYAQGSTNCIAEDTSGTAYLGTRRGLLVIDAEGHLVTCMDERDGLSSANVQGIQIVGDTLVWISTATGISCIRPLKVRGEYLLTHYGKLDGLSLDGRELRVGEIFYDEQTDSIYVGFGGGVCSFSPTALMASPRYAFLHVPAPALLQADGALPVFVWFLIGTLLVGILGILHIRFRRSKLPVTETKLQMTNGEVHAETAVSLSDEELQSSDPLPVVERSKEDTLFLERLQTIVETHLADDGFSVQGLASELAMDRTVLFRRMQVLIGLSPSVYIRQVRMETAARLLRESSESIDEIALQTGFTSTKYFTRIFKETFGVLPRQYRSADIDVSKLRKFRL